MIVAVFTALVALVAVNAKILPVPLDARPIELSLLVHAKVVPVVELPKSTSVVAVLLHTTWLP